MKAATAKNIALKVQARTKMENIYKIIKAAANRGYREVDIKTKDFHLFADEILEDEGYTVTKNMSTTSDYYRTKDLIYSYTVKW